jgi:hypothetical protein
MDMSLPPEGAYPSFSAALEAAQAHARTAGYALNILRSEKSGRGRDKKILACSRGGKYCSNISEQYRQRNTATCKTDCKFSVAIKEHADGSWAIIH